MNTAYRWAFRTLARGIPLAVCLLATFLARPCRAAASDPSQTLERRWQKIQNPTPSTSSREVIGFALDASAAGWKPEAVEKAIELLRGMQEMDPLERSYGNFRWTYGQAVVLDSNAVEFCLRHALVLQSDWKERLSPRATEMLHEIILRGVEGLKRHRVPVSYTNIYLMKAWNCIAAGEQLAIPALSREGYEMLDEWLLFTAHQGVTEYNSPNYYAVDLESLGLIARRAQDPSGREKAETALRYFWADIAAHWFGPAQRLAGANSRCYQYLNGRGELDRFACAQGWQQGTPPAGDAFFDACAWKPDEALVEPLRASVPRIVLQRWGNQPGAHATLFVGKHFALGTAGRCNSGDDRSFVLLTGETLNEPEIIFFMDGRGDPYGARTTPDKARHLKALHLTSFVANVQRGAEVLHVVEDNLQRTQQQRPADDFTCLLSHLTLPATAKVWSGGQLLAPGSQAKPAVLDAEKPFFVKIGSTVVGLRIVYSSNYAGKPAPLHYVQESPSAPMKRLTLVHAQGMPWGRGIAALWVRVAEDLDAQAEVAFENAFAEAKAQAEYRGTKLKLRAEGLEAPLVLEVDTEIGKVLRAEGQQPGTDAAILSVNGRDLGRELLAPYAK